MTLALPNRPDFPFAQFYPAQIASINRALAFGGLLRQQLVVVPGQFKADPNSSPTRGTQRLYSALNLAGSHRAEHRQRLHRAEY